MNALDGKAAVVTGVGRGIGRAHCLQLAGAGAAVVVNDIDLAEAESCAAEIRGRGGRAVADGSDIGTVAGAAQAVATCRSGFGQIDVMVANAGIVRDRTFLKMSEDDLRA